jgi:hypothetical protein
VITPYYFAYEDLVEDWEKVLEQQANDEATAAASVEAGAEGESKGSKRKATTAVKKLPAEPRVR